MTYIKSFWQLQWSVIKARLIPRQLNFYSSHTIKFCSFAMGQIEHSVKQSCIRTKRICLSKPTWQEEFCCSMWKPMILLLNESDGLSWLEIFNTTENVIFRHMAHLRQFCIYEVQLTLILATDDRFGSPLHLLSPDPFPFPPGQTFLAELFPDLLAAQCLDK